MDANRRIVQSRQFAEADWVAGRLAPFEAWTVSSIVPTGFESYARVFHPAGEGEHALTWGQLADRSSRVMHAHAEFELLVPPSIERLVGEPSRGFLPPELTRALADVTARHTETPERCWFCLWDGWGWVQGPPAIGLLVAAPDGPSRAVAKTPPRRGKTEFQLDGGRVTLPGRNYLLFVGPLAAITDFGYWIEQRVAERFFCEWSPNLWWPDDRAWCVATEIDLDSTYVGGSGALIRELLDDSRFEALQVESSDVRGDRINTQT
jgi:hypothetical protein